MFFHSRDALESKGSNSGILSIWSRIEIVFISAIHRDLKLN